jgi:hypothetical protein
VKAKCLKTGKVMYRYRLQAWVAADKFLKKFGTESGMYKCKHCKKFHLSRKVQHTPSKGALKIINK